MFKFKKMVALGMVATMILGSSLTAFAAAGDEDTEVEATGAGTGAFVDMNKYLIAVPTTDALTKTLAYTADPLGIVPGTDSSHVYEEGARVYFASDKTKTEVDFASTSENLVITNKSSIGITLDIEAKLDATGKTYNGGYSTTADFSGTNDKTAGLYFGLIADNEVEKPLSDTAVEFTNVALNAAKEYEVKVTSGVYSYDLKTATADTVYPTYNMKVAAVLNPDVAESVWYAEASNVRTAKTLPTISVKFTPNGIRDCKEASVLVDGEDFYISKTTEEGGFGTTKPDAILVNGKAIATIGDNVEGFVHVTWKDVYTAWGYTDTTIAALSEEDVTRIYEGVKNFKVTFGTTNAISYYGEVGAE